MNGTDLWTICHDQYFRFRVKLRSEKTRIQYRLALNNFNECLATTRRHYLDPRIVRQDQGPLFWPGQTG